MYSLFSSLWFRKSINDQGFSQFVSAVGSLNVAHKEVTEKGAGRERTERGDKDKEMFTLV